MTDHQSNTPPKKRQVSRATIIRTPKDGSSPYVATSHVSAQNEGLTFEARGLLWYLLSKPSDWQPSTAGLAHAGKCSETRVRRILKELEARGHIAVMDDPESAP